MNDATRSKIRRRNGTRRPLSPSLRSPSRSSGPRSRSIGIAGEADADRDGREQSGEPGRHVSTFVIRLISTNATT